MVCSSNTDAIPSCRETPLTLSPSLAQRFLKQLIWDQQEEDGSSDMTNVSFSPPKTAAPFFPQSPEGSCAQRFFKTFCQNWAGTLAMITSGYMLKSCGKAWGPKSIHGFPNKTQKHWAVLIVLQNGWNLRLKASQHLRDFTHILAQEAGSTGLEKSGWLMKMKHFHSETDLLPALVLSYLWWFLLLFEFICSREIAWYVTFYDYVEICPFLLF